MQQYELQQSPESPSFPEPYDVNDGMSNLAASQYGVNEQVPTGYPAPGQMQQYDSGMVPPAIPGTPDYLAAQQVGQAAESGQKEILDASALTLGLDSRIRSSRRSEAVKLLSETQDILAKTSRDQRGEPGLGRPNAATNVGPAQATSIGLEFKARVHSLGFAAGRKRGEN
jgi:hypothetical protein